MDRSAAFPQSSQITVGAAPHPALRPGSLGGKARLLSQFDRCIGDGRLAYTGSRDSFAGLQAYEPCKRLPHDRKDPNMPLWLIPTTYVVVSVACGIVLPRLEHAYLAAYTSGASASAAIAFYSAVSSGMMALTGIVFAISLVLVQFNAVSYSPRLVIVTANDPGLFHTLGLFMATFIYTLAALAWADRNGTAGAPLFSSILIMALLVASMLAFARLVHSISRLLVHNVLQDTGTKGRRVIKAMFPLADRTQSEEEAAPAVDPETAGPLRQTVVYEGEPQVVTHFEVARLVALAEREDALIVMECGVGETLIDSMVLLRVHGGRQDLPEAALRTAIGVGATRTFTQDPKYALRLLVDIAIRALSPAVNDPTTAVQALDHIEDLLRRLGRRRLDTGRAYDAAGRLRLVFPTPGWDDYLSLAFDEIRVFSATSVQVIRRLRSALVGLAESLATQERRRSVLQYLDDLNSGVIHSAFVERDQQAALGEDRQGLGLSRRQPATRASVRPGETRSRDLANPPAADHS